MKPFLGTLLGLIAVIALWIAFGCVAFVLFWASDRGTSATVGAAWLLSGLALAIGYARWVRRRADADSEKVSVEIIRARRNLRKN